MRTKFQNSLTFKALSISTSLNGLLVFFGVLGNLVKALSGLTWISTAIAAPPARLVGWMLKPKGSSFGEIIAASVGAFFVSILFYTVVAWIVLRLWTYLHSRPRR